MNSKRYKNFVILYASAQHPQEIWMSISAHLGKHKLWHRKIIVTYINVSLFSLMSLNLCWFVFVVAVVLFLMLMLILSAVYTVSVAILASYFLRRSISILCFISLSRFCWFSYLYYGSSEKLNYNYVYIKHPLAEEKKNGKIKLKKLTKKETKRWDLLVLANE